MRYWQHNETGRLLKVDLQMAPSNWTEISEEEYKEAERIKDETSISTSLLVQ